MLGFTGVWTEGFTCLGRPSMLEPCLQSFFHWLFLRQTLALCLGQPWTIILLSDNHHNKDDRLTPPCPVFSGETGSCELFALIDVELKLLLVRICIKMLNGVESANILHLCLMLWRKHLIIHSFTIYMICVFSCFFFFFRLWKFPSVSTLSFYHE
jgi:hypothetical protein